jgi:pimeloyl-ACP methyl ester carboxylesterase
VTGISDSVRVIPVWFSIRFKTSRPGPAGRSQIEGDPFMHVSVNGCGCYSTSKARNDRIRCPTLVIGGEDDPMHPIESQADIAAALPPSLVQFERFADCGHGVVPDAPERAMDLLGEFIQRR